MTACGGIEACTIFFVSWSPARIRRAIAPSMKRGMFLTRVVRVSDMFRVDKGRLRDAFDLLERGRAALAHSGIPWVLAYALGVVPAARALLARRFFHPDRQSGQLAMAGV